LSSTTKTALIFVTPSITKDTNQIKVLLTIFSMSEETAVRCETTRSRFEQGTTGKLLRNHTILSYLIYRQFLATALTGPRF